MKFEINDEVYFLMGNEIKKGKITGYNNHVITSWNESRKEFTSECSNTRYEIQRAYSRDEKEVFLEPKQALDHVWDTFLLSEEGLKYTQK